jgi:hypothetical protein
MLPLLLLLLAQHVVLCVWEWIIFSPVCNTGLLQTAAARFVPS